MRLDCNHKEVRREQWVKKEEENVSNQQRRRKEKLKRRTRLRLHLVWGDCGKIETFPSRVGWTNPRTP